jgi:hypothetical protein
MSEAHIEAMEVLKRKKQEYRATRQGVHQSSGRTTVHNPNAVAECQLLLLEITYLESRILSLSNMDLDFIV